MWLELQVSAGTGQTLSRTLRIEEGKHMIRKWTLPDAKIPIERYGKL